MASPQSANWLPRDAIGAQRASGQSIPELKSEASSLAAGYIFNEFERAASFRLQARYSNLAIPMLQFQARPLPSERVIRVLAIPNDTRQRVLSNSGARKSTPRSLPSSQLLAEILP